MKKNIFLIDDDHMICTLLGLLVGDVPSLEFESMSCSRKAVEHLRNVDSPPDLILVDMRMPEMNGLETLAQLKSLPNLSASRLALFTTAMDMDSIEEAENLGAVYIEKDYDFIIDNIKGVLM